MTAKYFLAMREIQMEKNYCAGIMCTVNYVEHWQSILIKTAIRFQTNRWWKSIDILKKKQEEIWHFRYTIIIESFT